MGCDKILTIFTSIFYPLRRAAVYPKICCFIRNRLPSTPCNWTFAKKNNMEQNTPKHVLITGGNRGIGLALGKKLLAEGYAVTLTSRTGKIDGLEHSSLQMLKMEITDLHSIKAAAGELKARVRNIDILVNNAGIANDPYDILPEYEKFRRTIDVNLTGLVFFNEAVLDQVASGGHIINITSDMGLLSQAQSNGPAYRISKAAVNMYTKMLSQRVEEKNIRVTAAHPGWVRTNVGGEDASMDVEWCADGLYRLILDCKRSGEFRNIYTGDCYLL
jgi:NAD(P)-dependent dehydrogenase (short-subunit alcohol dehydrogenase family)